MLLSINGKLSSDNVLKEIKSLAPAQNKLYRQDDIGIARLFADVFKDVARYNTTAKAWYIYDGKRWRKDAESMNVEGYAKMLSRSLLIYSADVGDKYYTEFVNKLQDRKRREVLIKDARSFSFVETTDFDQNPYLFNCQNCVVDLKSSRHFDHDPSLLLSKISNVYYDEDAVSSDFDAFIREIMKDDQSKIDYLQRVFGYALTGENTQEEAYIAYGATTRNGKSTLLDTLQYMFGDYSCNIQPESLAQKDKNSRNASGDIARLDGIRFLHCGEPPKRMRFDVALLKSLLGRDPITARFLYESDFQFTPVFKLFINTNFLPLVTDDTLFSSGRLKVITFDRHFEPEEQDIHLKTRLKSRDNIAGLFNWCLEGLMKYQDEGEILDPPLEVENATNDYREKSDKVKSFINDCLIPCDGGTISAKKAYEVYTAWCQDSGFGVENKSNFFDELRTKGLLVDRGTVGGQSVHNVIKGYLLDETFLPDYRNPFD